MADRLDNPDGTRDVGVVIADSAVRVNKLFSWHKANVSFYPTDRRTFEQDFDDVIREYIVPGHTPPAPMLEAGDLVIALGSCFARELRSFLSKAGLASTRIRIPEGLANSFAILDFFSWVVRGEETGTGFRYARLESGEIQDWTPEDERQEFRSAFADASAFLLTVGIAEVWQDKETGGVFWRGVPKEIFDGDRHVFRLTSVDENVANLLQVVELIREVNPGAPIIFTLSPVPLEATFRDMSCMAADCVSKSTLRVAIDGVLASGVPNVYYWPGFEMVKWAGPHLSWPAYGFHDDRARHVTPYLVERVIDAFIGAFYKPEAAAFLRSRRKSVPRPTSLQGRLQAITERRKKRASMKKG
jgi:hypothetical protein